MNRWVVQLLAKLNASRSGKTVFIALATFEEGRLVISDDPTGFLSSLAKKAHKTREQVLEDCLDFARRGILLGHWRFFIVDEILLGKRQQRLMASMVAYRSGYPASSISVTTLQPDQPA